MAGERGKHPNYDVGYGRPPKHSRWAKGQSGNEKGRRRAAAPVTRDEVLARALGRSITVPDGDGVIEMSLLQALIEQTAVAGLKGDRHARRDVLRLVRHINYVGESSGNRAQDLSEVDRLRAQNEELRECLEQAMTLLDEGADEEEQGHEERFMTPASEDTAPRGESEGDVPRSAPDLGQDPDLSAASTKDDEAVLFDDDLDFDEDR